MKSKKINLLKSVNITNFKCTRSVFAEKLKHAIFFGVCVGSLILAGCHANDDGKMNSLVSDINSTTQTTSTISSQSSTTTSALPITTNSIILPEPTPNSTESTSSTKHTHKYKTSISKPDCITSGYTTYTCTCGYSYQDDYVKSLGHKWSKWKTVKEATTNTAGQRVRSCSVCNLTDYLNIPQLPPRFAKAVGVCKTENVKYETGQKGEYEYAAVAEMYVCGSEDTKAEASLKKEFKEAFGFTATAKVTKKYIGEFTVDGKEEAQKVYCYQIYDTTYPLCDNEMYVIYHQKCSDGSPWVGFCIYGTMDTLATEANTTRYRKLEKQMLEEFEKVVGKSIEEMEKLPNKYSIDNISQAGTVRTKNRTLVDVLYIYCRSYADQ